MREVRTLLDERDTNRWAIAASIVEAIEAGRPGVDTGIAERIQAFGDAVGLASSTVERDRSVALYWREATGEIPPRVGVSLPWSSFRDLMPQFPGDPHSALLFIASLADREPETPSGRWTYARVFDVLDGERRLVVDPFASDVAESARAGSGDLMGTLLEEARASGPTAAAPTADRAINRKRNPRRRGLDQVTSLLEQAADLLSLLGFILTEPLAFLFLIAALLAWHPNRRVRIVTIVAPILTFVQLVLAVVGKWVGGLHVLNAILILGMYGWLTYTLRHEQPALAAAGPAALPAD